ncbi:hypothetical protein NEAUS06_1786 [Nematocida ausubeli]|nr:hypothetical protein NEAUS06_1786 [Nematocida ausubeli]
MRLFKKRFTHHILLTLQTICLFKPITPRCLSVPDIGAVLTTKVAVDKDHRKIVINPDGPLNPLRGYISKESGYTYNKRLFSPEISTDYKIQEVKQDEGPLLYHNERNPLGDRAYLETLKGNELFIYLERYHNVLISLFYPYKDSVTAYHNEVPRNCFYNFLKSNSRSSLDLHILANLLLISEGMDSFMEIRTNNDYEKEIVIEIEDGNFQHVDLNLNKSVPKKKLFRRAKPVKKIDRYESSIKIIEFFINNRANPIFLSGGKYSDPKTFERFQQGRFLNTPKWLIQAYIYEYIDSIQAMNSFIKIIYNNLQRYMSMEDIPDQVDTPNDLTVNIPEIIKQQASEFKVKTFKTVFKKVPKDLMHFFKYKAIPVQVKVEEKNVKKIERRKLNSIIPPQDIYNNFFCIDVSVTSIYNEQIDFLMQIDDILTQPKQLCIRTLGKALTATDTKLVRLFRIDSEETILSYIDEILVDTPNISLVTLFKFWFHSNDAKYQTDRYALKVANSDVGNFFSTCLTSDTLLDGRIVSRWNYIIKKITNKTNVELSGEFIDNGFLNIFRFMVYTIHKNYQKEFLNILDDLEKILNVKSTDSINEHDREKYIDAKECLKYFIEFFFGLMFNIKKDEKMDVFGQLKKNIEVSFHQLKIESYNDRIEIFGDINVCYTYNREKVLFKFKTDQNATSMSIPTACMVMAEEEKDELTKIEDTVLKSTPKTFIAYMYHTHILNMIHNSKLLIQDKIISDHTIRQLKEKELEHFNTMHLYGKINTLRHKINAITCFLSIATDISLKEPNKFIRVLRYINNLIGSISFNKKSVEVKNLLLPILSHVGIDQNYFPNLPESMLSGIYPKCETDINIASLLLKYALALKDPNRIFCWIRIHLDLEDLPNKNTISMILSQLNYYETIDFVMLLTNNFTSTFYLEELCKHMCKNRRKVLKKPFFEFPREVESIYYMCLYIACQESKLTNQNMKFIHETICFLHKLPLYYAVLPTYIVKMTPFGIENFVKIINMHLNDACRRRDSLKFNRIYSILSKLNCFNTHNKLKCPTLESLILNRAKFRKAFSDPEWKPPRLGV